MGHTLNRYCCFQVSIRDHLLSNLGLNELLVEELVTGVMRVNYGQVHDMTAGP